MPVSTRSQITEQNESIPDHGTRPGNRHDDTHIGLPSRNPHQGLKEKMKALTLLYEQQKQASMALKNAASRPQEQTLSTHPCVELFSSVKTEEIRPKQGNVMKENTLPNSTITRTFVLPLPMVDDAKENMIAGVDRIVGFSCPRKAPVSNSVARKLSMGAAEPRGIEGIKNMQETEVISARPGTGSRILVFVRLRPMAKKEKEAGSRCCVRIVNRRDLYLTEFASENDYLRLKRLRGRHFTFDASFPDSATQQEVYSTT